MSAPKLGDSNNRLLFKICEEFSERSGGLYPPRLGDSDNTLLFKICRLVNSEIVPLIGEPASLNLMEIFSLSTSGQSGLVNMDLTSLTVQADVLNSRFILSGAQFPNLESITFTASLSNVTHQITGFPALTAIRFPNLMEIAVGGTVLNLNSNPSLVTVDLPVLVPNNGQNFNFSGSALSAASINNILAKCVANAAYVSGTLTLNGGTNSPPTGQGVADKATLQARGVTVNTN